MDKFVELPSKIVSVTVYRTGARITRACELRRDGEGFSPSVSVSNLPLALEDDSVRVRVESKDEGTPPVARHFRVALDTVKGAAESKDTLRAALEIQAVEVEKSQRLFDGLMGFRKSLLSVEMKERPLGKRGEPPIESPVECRLKWMEFRRKRLCDLDLTIEKQKARHLELVEKRDALSAKLTEASSAEAPRATELRKALAVTLDAEGAKANAAVLIVEYLVPGAKWAPCYDLAMKKGGDIRLSLRASVAQRTGEDWSDVSLSLSTALPGRFSALPELKALRVGKRQTGVKKPQRPVESVEPLYADYDAAVSKIPKPAPRPAQEEYATPSDQAVRTQAAGGAAAPLPTFAPPPPFIPAPAGPPPVPQAPPMPVLSAASPKRAALKSAPFLSRTLSGSVDFAKAKQWVEPQAEEALRPSSMQRSSGYFSGSPFTEIAEEEAELAPDASLLDFGNLRMGAPDSKSRGRIRPVSAGERRLELLMFQSAEVNVNLMQLVHAAVEAAKEVTCATLPPLREFEGRQEDEREVDFDCIYPSDYPADIPSDGQAHTVNLKSATAWAELCYVAVPREALQVYRLLRFTNPFPFPLLRGRADVTADGKVLPSGEIAATPASGKAELWLGAEQRIKISRNTDFKEETAGLLRGQTALVHAVDIKLVNHLPDKAVVEVRERIPVTKEKEDIKVALKKVEPMWQPFDQREKPIKGGYMWTASVNSGEEKRLFAEYAVTVSSKDRLVGGNRREA